MSSTQWYVFHAAGEFCVKHNSNSSIRQKAWDLESENSQQALLCTKHFSAGCFVLSVACSVTDVTDAVCLQLYKNISEGCSIFG